MFHTGIVKSLLITASAACVIGLVTATSATAQNPLPGATAEEMRQEYEGANVLLEQGDYDAAIEEFSTIIQKYGAFGQIAPAYVGRAKAFEALQDFNAAVKDYRAALDLESEGPQDNQVMAMAYNGRGEITLQFSAINSSPTIAVTQALDDFMKAVENDRTNPLYRVNQAKALVRFYQAEPALRALKRALALDENNAEAYRTRAQAYALLQDFQRAAEDISTATQLEPDNHENHYVKGMIYMQAKQHQLAVQAFMAAKENYTDPDPENPTPYVEPYLAASLAYIELGKEAPTPEIRQAAYTKAIEETQKALDEQPMLPLAYLNRGVALRLLEFYEDALMAFTEAINMAPQFGEAYFRRGIVWYHMGDRELARKDFREAIAISYDDVRPYLWTGITYADEGKYHDAIVQYGEAINLVPRYVPAYVNRGLAYAQLGEYERAEDSFADAISLEPAEPTHYFKRGSVRMAMQRYDDALNDFSKAISHANYYVDAYRKAAEALQHLGQRDLAAQYAQEADKIEAAIRQRIEEIRNQAEQGEGVSETEDVLRFEEEAPIPADPGLEADPDPALPALPINPDAVNPFE